MFTWEYPRRIYACEDKACAICDIQRSIKRAKMAKKRTEMDSMDTDLAVRELVGAKSAIRPSDVSHWTPFTVYAYPVRLNHSDKWSTFCVTVLPMPDGREAIACNIEETDAVMQAWTCDCTLSIIDFAIACSRKGGQCPRCYTAYDPIVTSPLDAN